YDGAGRDNCKAIEITEDLRAQAEEYREKLMDEVAENSDALMERYLEGEEIAHDEIVQALEHGVEEGHLFPVTCGITTKNLATNRLLDAIVDDLPSPAQSGALDAGERHLDPDPDGPTIAYVYKTLSDPFTGRINYFRVYQGTVKADSHLVNCRTHQKERVGSLLVPHG